jgi:hypothetical protein
MTMHDISPGTFRARELYGDFWFNGEPIPVTALRGQVVLLFFWDFANSACLRVLPYVREWERRYAPYGMVTVGVHTPRFPFEKDIEGVQKAIARHQVSFPVVTDSQALIAANYDCRTMPELLLIDKDGFVRYRNEGDNGYAGFEHVLQALLYMSGAGGEMPDVMAPVRETDRAGAFCFRATPEVLTGYLRGSIGNTEGYAPESAQTYTDPGMYLDGRFYAEGDWVNERERLRAEDSGGREARLIIPYQGVDVEAVLGAEGTEQAELTVLQDNVFVASGARGSDLKIGPDGRSFLVVDAPRVYHVVRNREYGDHTLTLAGGAGRYAAYAFSFTTAVIPELIAKN